MTAHHHALRAQTVRRALRVITLAWVFGAAWQWGVQSVAQIQFAKSLHMTDGGFGLLAMAPLLAGAIQVPVSLLMARFGHRRFVFMLSLALGRLTWAAMAIIPWVLPDAADWWWRLLIWLTFFSYIGLNVSTVPWMNWMADVIPWKVRGRYFAFRNRIGLLVGIASTLTVGVLLDHALSPSAMLKITSLVLGVGGLVGAIDPLCFFAIKDPSPPPNRPGTSVIDFLIEPLSDRSFRWYLAYNFTITLGLTAFGTYVWLYGLYVVGLSNTTSTVLMQVVTMVAMVASYGLWGTIMDRLGRRPVLIICTALAVLQPLGWMFIRPGMIWIGYAITLPALATWAGVEAANFNLLLNISGSRESRHGAACVALTALATCAGGVVSGLLGALIADRMANWHHEVPAIHATFTYHSLIFAFTAAARLAAAWMAVKIHEPDSHGTRQVIRHVTTLFYTNVKQMMALPTLLGWWD